MAQTRTTHLNSFGQRLNRVILAEDQHFQTIAQVLQRIAIALRDALFRNSRNSRHYGLNIRHVDRFLTFAHRHQTRPSARFVNHVNGFIRQMAVIDIFYRQLDRRTHRFRGITHVVVRFVLRFQAVDNLHRLFHRRLGNINFLETAR
ncbi:Protein of uncharacterised function (DUF3170) [Salmonella enterica subsp. enterica serovar Bovismorbificans]|uniref:Protein of uncharacterized function (DUF3170) n=1 Tax=Salmonella enterica subsp. enterica serovar Bovismorbificans TaxID=58097 RepID=A0A655BM64_SALET|nr:Protein of uncharacterised function (DUF3170) [Salmonella enterica subsp. enterica serovar Bovismorbificans]CPR41596.1 Protein of uncharacterised function (DUF3170) [Salmonella enterica subsp. enterica serovar Bovismorbificans]CPR53332.1 Protein of uncharacterised function (DUF3170) [Salmonella enterica subsp. enterica serovar Bovismorbificans]CQB62387.1 Protein of uncharacterised function (DUF3170) [Salmonella enterica subsp. enterica serovar Bovismorbificans]CQL76691.1 Protein of uncharact